jgi:hypothetical protein
MSFLARRSGVVGELGVADGRTVSCSSITVMTAGGSGGGISIFGRGFSGWLVSFAT